MFFWLKSNEAKTIADQAKARAWADLKMKYPNVDSSRFKARVYFDDHKASSEIYFKHSNGVETVVSKLDRTYWSDELRKELAIG